MGGTTADAAQPCGVAASRAPCAALRCVAHGERRTAALCLALRHLNSGPHTRLHVPQEWGIAKPALLTGARLQPGEKPPTAGEARTDEGSAPSPPGADASPSPAGDAAKPTDA